MSTGTLPFDYRTATRDAVVAQARGLVGRRIGDVLAFPEFNDLPGPSTKGVVGAAYEAFFGIPPNSRAGADFPAARIELKSTPIIVGPYGARAKERISLGMIDLDTLGSEEWARASVRKKLDRLLICFYGWRPDVPIGDFPTLAAVLWRPTEGEARVLEGDWTLVRDMVRAGRAAEISEALGRWLGAATKGSGGPGWSERRRRAWSLKPPFVAGIYTAATNPSGPAMSDGGRILSSESRQLAILESREGRSVEDIATEFGVGGSRAKNAPASIIRRLLGLPARGMPAGPDWIGIEVKTVPVAPSGVPLEQMSFPSFRHLEVADQDWEDSDLLARLSRLLLIPLVRARRSDPIMSASLGRARFWTPSPQQLAGIRAEWEMFRDAIRRGEADRLPSASGTRFIHVRPKDRRAQPSDPAPGGLRVTRKSFWLNGSFVELILSAEPVSARIR